MHSAPEETRTYLPHRKLDEFHTNPSPTKVLSTEPVDRVHRGCPARLKIKTLARGAIARGAVGKAEQWLRSRPQVASIL